MSPITLLNEQFRIDVIMPPRCKAVIDDAKENTCQCLKNYRKLYPDRDESENTSIYKQTSRDTDGKIFFKKCGSGDMEITIRRTDGVAIDMHYIATHQKQFQELFEELFLLTDNLHIKEGNREDALTYDETTQIYHLYLHRGLPKKVAVNYPNVTKEKRAPAPRRSS